MDTSSQMISRYLTAALRAVKGAKVSVHAISADGTKAESWCAPHAQIPIEMPVSDEAAEMVAAALREAGVRDVACDRHSGFVAGQTQCHVA